MAEKEVVPPSPCIKCGAEAKLRRKCSKCGEGVWVYEHKVLPGMVRPHYSWGLEVVPCKCAQSAKRGENTTANQARRMKRNKRVTRETGKVFQTEKYGPQTTPEMARKAAELLAQGMKIGSALKEAGFPPGTAKQGKLALNKMIRLEMKKIGGKYIQLAKDLTAEEQELIVRGMLLENVLLKTDKGVAAAKQLGADKRVAMWQTDSQVGMIVLQPPAAPKLDHEVPWVETRASQLLNEDKEENHANQSVASVNPSR